MRGFRRDTHPLLLIGIWALLESAAIVCTAVLPGDPFYADSGMGSLGQAVFVTALLVVFVALGSRVAWWLGIFSSTVGVGLPIAVLLVDLSVKPILVALIEAAALWLIWSGSIETYVHARRRRVTALR
jgi:hypothetical protein